MHLIRYSDVMERHAANEHEHKMSMGSIGVYGILKWFMGSNGIEKFGTPQTRITITVEEICNLIGYKRRAILDHLHKLQLNRCLEYKKGTGRKAPGVLRIRQDDWEEFAE